MQKITQNIKHNKPVNHTKYVNQNILQKHT